MTSTAVAFPQPSPPPPGPGRGPGPAQRTGPDDAAGAPRVLTSDAAAAGTGSGRAETAALLAEVALHRGVETPLAIGILGPAGSGKSRVLGDLLDGASGLAAAAGAAPVPGPFVSRVVMARIAAVPGRAPAGQIASGVVAALARHHAGFAEEALHAGGDAGETARHAGDRVDALRRALDAERHTLDGIAARRTRLTDTVLFDAGGSRVDGFAQANRGLIEARLRAFGQSAADPIRRYKELVRDAATPSGGGLRLRAFWGFRRQGALLAAAVLLGAVGWAIVAVGDNPEAAWGVTDQVRAHPELIQPASRIAFALAALALLAVLVRASRFLAPIRKGATLLKGELDGRRRDLDGLLAHQTRRVDALAAEVEAAGQGAETAQRRVEARRGTGLSETGVALADTLFGPTRTPEAAADAFFAALGDAMMARREDAPERLIVALDGLDRLPTGEMAALLETAGRLLGRPGIVTLVALERDGALAALGEFDPALAAARLDRALQLTYDLGADPADPAALVERLLDGRAADGTPPWTDGSRSALDRASEPFEAILLKNLAPFTGGTPRAVKRFVNSYRVARVDPRLDRPSPGTLGLLALALALDGTAAGSELAGFDADIAAGRVGVNQESDFGRAFVAVLSSVGNEVRAQDMRLGLAVARRYGRRG